MPICSLAPRNKRYPSQLPAGRALIAVISVLVEHQALISKDVGRKSNSAKSIVNSYIGTSKEIEITLYDLLKSSIS